MAQLWLYIDVDVDYAPCTRLAYTFNRLALTDEDDEDDVATCI